MKMRDAVEKSIIGFYRGKLPEEAIKASDGEYIYTLEYFDKLLEDADNEK